MSCIDIAYHFCVVVGNHIREPDSPAYGGSPSNSYEGRSKIVRGESRNFSREGGGWLTANPLYPCPLPSLPPLLPLVQSKNSCQVMKYCNSFIFKSDGSYLLGRAIRGTANCRWSVVCRNLCWWSRRLLKLNFLRCTPHYLVHCYEILLSGKNLASFCVQRSAGNHPRCMHTNYKHEINNLWRQHLGSDDGDRIYYCERRHDT